MDWKFLKPTCSPIVPVVLPTILQCLQPAPEEMAVGAWNLPPAMHRLSYLVGKVSQSCCVKHLE